MIFFQVRSSNLFTPIFFSRFDLISFQVQFISFVTPLSFAFVKEGKFDYRTANVCKGHENVIDF